MRHKKKSKEICTRKRSSRLGRPSCVEGFQASAYLEDYLGSLYPTRESISYGGYSPVWRIRTWRLVQLLSTSADSFCLFHM